MVKEQGSGKRASDVRRKRRAVERANIKHSMGILDYMSMAVKSMDVCITEARKYTQMGQQAEQHFLSLALTDDAVKLFSDGVDKVELHRNKYMIYNLILKDIALCTPKSDKDWMDLVKVIKDKFTDEIGDDAIEGYKGDARRDLISALYRDCRKGVQTEDKRELAGLIEGKCTMQWRKLPTLDTEPTEYALHSVQGSGDEGVSEGVETDND